MLIISVRDNENNRGNRNAKIKQKPEQKTKTGKNNGGRGRNYSKRGRDKRFCCAFKLSFLQLICKVSLVFKSNIELALSIMLK